MLNSLLWAERLPWSGLVSSCACFLVVCFLNVSFGALLECLRLPFLHHGLLSPFFVTVVLLNVFSDAFIWEWKAWMKVKFKFLKSQVSFIGFRNSGSNFSKKFTHTHSVLRYLVMQTKCFSKEAFKWTAQNLVNSWMWKVMIFNSC